MESSIADITEHYWQRTDTIFLNSYSGQSPIPKPIFKESAIPSIIFSEIVPKT